MTSGKPVQINLIFANSGNVDADHARGLGQVFIADDSDDKAESKIVADFKEKLKKTSFTTDGNIPAGGQQQFWFTASSDRTLTDEDLKKLNLGQQFLYLIASVTWNDPSGNHYLHICRRLQPPGNISGGVVVWQYCRYFEDHH